MWLMFQMTFGEQNTEKEAHEMLSYAFEHGINILDTSEAVSSVAYFNHIYTQMCTFVAFDSPSIYRAWNLMTSLVFLMEL